jgi:hypothetical protein
MRVAKFAETEPSIIYEYDVKSILCKLRDNELADMQDPMGISGLIPACKTEIKKLDALSKLETAATRAEKARDASSNGKLSEAFDWWRLLYNNEFPTYYY